MQWFIACLAVLVLGIAAVAATGRLGQLGSFQIDRAPLDLPSRPLTADDLLQVRFEVVPRGYAMDQVDEVMRRLQEQMRETVVIDEESGIIETNQLSDRRNHDGSDETSYGGWTD